MPNEIRYIKHPNNCAEIIGEFCMTPMPGCPRVGISHGLVIYPQYQKQGLSKKTQKQRDDLAIELGFIVIVSTTKVGNAAQEHRQEWNGAKCVNTFHNPATKHDVKLYTRHLHDWRQNL